MVSYLQAGNITRRIGDRILFESIALNVNSDEKVAIIAVNGAGKSSLLDIIAGEESPDSGSVSIKKGLKIAYLKQSPLLNETNTIGDELFSTGSELTETIRQYEKSLLTEDNLQMQDILQKMDDLKAWDYEVAVKQILFKLKLTEINAVIGSLSGGQKKRVALAKVLAEESDLLILDEPTNHLDLEMIEWLEEYLIKSCKCIIMVTHDRYFLDRVCNVIFELSEKELFRFDGNYEYFLEKKQQREFSEQVNIEKTKNLYRSELDWMRRMPKARRHKAKSRIDSFNDLREKAASKGFGNILKINVETARIGKKILVLRNISKSYGSKTLIKNFAYTFNRYEKIGFVGKNGTGKTTFLDIITGINAPDEGIIEKGETIVFGYYRQQGIEFDEEMTIIDAVREISENVSLSDGKVLSVTQFLNIFLFPPEKHNTFIKRLSGGEKRRLYLLTVLMQNPNFLILDEPTNDLDVLTLNVLENYLAEFRGCVIVVSHDRYFMDKVVDHIFEFRGDGLIKDFPGNYTQYREALDEIEDRNRTFPDEKKDFIVPKSGTKPKDQEKKGLTYKEKQELETLITEIITLEEERKNIERSLSENIMTQEELHQKSKRHGEIIKLLDIKELRWLELSEK